MLRPGAGNVVGHEWKSLVESSLSAEDASRRDAQTHAASSARDSPALGASSSGNNGSGGNLNKVGSGEMLLDEDGTARERVVEKDKQAPRWQGEIKIDVLRELEDVANMTIAETGFFCK